MDRLMTNDYQAGETEDRRDRREEVEPEVDEANVETMQRKLEDSEMTEHDWMLKEVRRGEWIEKRTNVTEATAEKIAAG